MKAFAALTIAVVLILAGCCSVNKQAVNDVATDGLKWSSQLQVYWDADVAAGKHDAAWATARKAELQAWMKALTSLQNAVK